MHLHYLCRFIYNKAAIEPPTIGPTIGIHAYAQSLVPLLLIGKIACMIRGPKSRAGFMAYPVVPPSESPITQTKNATGIAPTEPKPIGVLVGVISAPVI